MWRRAGIERHGTGEFGNPLSDTDGEHPYFSRDAAFMDNTASSIREWKSMEGDILGGSSDAVTALSASNEIQTQLTNIVSNLDGSNLFVKARS